MRMSVCIQRTTYLRRYYIHCAPVRTHHPHPPTLVTTPSHRSTARLRTHHLLRAATQLVVWALLDRVPPRTTPHLYLHSGGGGLVRPLLAVMTLVVIPAFTTGCRAIAHARCRRQRLFHRSAYRASTVHLCVLGLLALPFLVLLARGRTISAGFDLCCVTTTACIRTARGEHYWRCTAPATAYTGAATHHLRTPLPATTGTLARLRIPTACPSFLTT